ncbi:MAG TPA: SDR family oxidoreductase, partial [Steroidobacteraceae bacterium]|nr:SDR family oxidoreductase [Steroidobacteraceae bacterium]
MGRRSLMGADEDLHACLRALRAIHADRGLLTKLPQHERRELLMLAGQVAKPERAALRQMARAFRRAERSAGLAQDREALERAGLRVQRRSERYTPLWLPPPEAGGDAAGQAAPREPSTLNSARACYVCKQPFTQVHRYYDSMCQECGDFNYAKREYTADLSGRVALVTGARVKIGYQAALKLLRAGARVVALTRFPVDAAARYAQEPDYAEWRERLQVHGLDLRHTPSVEIFSRWLAAELPRLDYVLNNACQTVRRPAGFFRHLLEREAGGAAALPAP